MSHIPGHIDEGAARNAEPTTQEEYIKATEQELTPEEAAREFRRREGAKVGTPKTPVPSVVTPAAPPTAPPTLTSRAKEIAESFPKDTRKGDLLAKFKELNEGSRPEKNEELSAAPSVPGREGDTSPGGLYVFTGGAWRPDPTAMKTASDSYRTEMSVWRNNSMDALRMEFSLSDSEINAYITGLELSFEETKIAGEKEEGKLQRQHQMDLAKAEAKAQGERDIILHDNAIKIIDKQTEAALSIVSNEQESIDRRAALDRAIAQGNLDELVLNNRELRRLDEKRIGLEEQRDKWDFLGRMLSSGGLGFFTLAMIDPTAAKTLFSQLAPGGVGDLGGPFAAALKYRGQISGGGLEIPSAQEVARGSPLENLYRQEAFAGQGRDVAAEVEEITPESPGRVARRRA